MKIVVRRRSDDYHACVEGKTGIWGAIWGASRSANGAIGNMVSAHPEVFGIEAIEWPEPSPSTAENDPPANAK